MTIALEPQCWSTLHGMSANFSQVYSEATRHSVWDKSAIQEIGQNLYELANDCRILRSPEQICTDDAGKLMDALVEILKNEDDAVDGNKIDDQLEAMGQHLADLQGCLYDHYAIASDLGSPEGPVTDWPDTGWMAVIKPSRITTRKR